MRRALVLRFDAPLISFGAPMVDQNGVVQQMPALSMLTGLLGNALGLTHGEHRRLERLQERIRFASRTDCAGEAISDYQIVDLGQPWMDARANGWTTRGRLTTRGGASSEGLHIRYRHYRANSVHTVVVELDPPGEEPTLDQVAAALQEPARPLFIGRRTCLPATPIFLTFVEAPSLLAVLSRTPRAHRADKGPLQAWWEDGEPDRDALSVGAIVPVTDERNWRDQIHVGRRLLRQGRVDPPLEHGFPSKGQTR